MTRSLIISTHLITWMVFIVIVQAKPLKDNDCTPEQYYASGLRKCVYCAVLCTKAEARGQLAECLTFCPDYFKKSTTTLTIPGSYGTTTLPGPVQGWDTKDSIGLIISGAVFCVTVIVLLLIFCGIKRSRDGGKGQHELLEQRNRDQVDAENPNIQGCPQQNCQSNSGIQDTQPPMSSTLLISSASV